MPKLFERDTFTAISRLRVTASWSGFNARRRRKSAIYTVPPGYGVLSTNVKVHSSNNGSRSVDAIGAGLDLLTETEVSSVFSFAVNMAGKLNDDNLKAKLEQQEKELLREIDRYKSTGNVVKATVEATPHGDPLLNRKRGWEEITVYAEVIFLGGDSGDDLAAALEEEHEVLVSDIDAESIINAIPNASEDIKSKLKMSFSDQSIAK